MESFVCGVCQEEASSLCTCSSYLCKNHTEDHKCSDSLDKIMISLYKKVDDESRSIIALYLEQIKAMIASLLSLRVADLKYYNELCRQSKQIDDQLLFVRNARFIKNSLFLSPIEFFLTKAQSETNKFIEEAPIPNIDLGQTIDFQQIEKIINNIYNFNYFKLYDVINFEINWISEKNNDLFTLFYQKGIEFLWSKSYENASKSFLLCQSISENAVSYEKVCKEILNLALNTTEQFLQDKDKGEIKLSIKQTVKILQDIFPTSLNLIFYEASRIHTSIENYKKAIKLSLECLKNIQEDKDKFYIWTYLGFLYQCALDFESATIYYDKCEASINSNQIYSEKNLINWYLNTAEFHNIKCEYEKAIDKYKLGLNICKQNPMNYQIFINFHFKLGDAFNNLNNFKKSKKHYLRAKDLSQEYNSYNLIGICIKLSEFYLKYFEFDEAQKAAESCIKLCKISESNEAMNLAAIYRILGIIKFHIGDFEKCELFLLRSLNICEKNDFNWLYFIIGLNVLELYYLSNNCNEFNRHMQILNKKFEELNSKNYNNFLFYDILSKFYVLNYNVDKVNTISDIWQQKRNNILEYDTNERCEIYCLNAMKCIYSKDYQESENWLMKWKISLKSSKILSISQYFKFSSFVGWSYVSFSNILKAIDIFLDLLKDLESCLACDSPKLGVLYIYLGLFYTQTKQLLKAVDYFKKALSIFGVKYQSNEILFNLYNNLGALSMILYDLDLRNYFLKAKDLLSKTK